MSDVNLHSFIGPDDNGRTVELGDIALDPAANIASPIKCTQMVQELTITAGTVEGGHDAVLDCNNHAKKVNVHIQRAMPKGQFAVVAKGGTSELTVKIDELVGHGRVADCITDDYSDQDPRTPTEAIKYDIKTKDGSAVTILALRTKPTFAPGSGPYRFVFPWPCINPAWLGYPCGQAFYVLRRWGFFRAQAN